MQEKFSHKKKGTNFPPLLSLLFCLLVRSPSLFSYFLFVSYAFCSLYMTYNCGGEKE